MRNGNSRIDAPPIVEVHGLVKHFREVTAVNGVDIAVPEGICFGMLGPNGAGKTTSIEIMEGIQKPSAGTIQYRGKRIGRQYQERIGIQFQQTALPEFITVHGILKVFSALYKKTVPIEEIIKICSLQDIIDRNNRKLSGGQRQRLLLGIALVNDPDLLYLDEPTTGLDPQSRRNFWELIQRLKAEKRSIVLTTHYMEEAELLCDVIAIMNHGKVIAYDTPQKLLKENFSGVIVRIPHDDAALKLFKEEDITAHDDVMDIQTTEIDRVIRTLVKAEVRLDGLQVHTPNLDDLFLKLTGTSLRD